MKALSLSVLLPLIYIFGFHSSLVLSAQRPKRPQDVGGCPPYVWYDFPYRWATYMSNYPNFSHQPAWITDDTLDPALVVTDGQLNYLNGLPANGPFATSRDDFIQKVEKGLQFPYRDYIGEIKYSFSPAGINEGFCEYLGYEFSATAQTIKRRYVHFTFYCQVQDSVHFFFFISFITYTGAPNTHMILSHNPTTLKFNSSSIQTFSSNSYSSVPIGTTVTWAGSLAIILSYNETSPLYRILLITSSQDWLTYLSGVGIKIELQED
jgi:hypothetical protein